MTSVLGVALADRRALTIGLLAAVAAAVLFAAGGQMLTFAPGGPVLLVTSAKAVIFAGLALLVGLQAALQAFAYRLRVRQGGVGAGAGGILFAFLGASCCTPIIWPALLSLAGVSGVTLLGLNAWLHAWFWLPVSLSAVAMTVALWRTTRALAVPCRVPAEES